MADDEDVKNWIKALFDDDDDDDVGITTILSLIMFGIAVAIGLSVIVLIICLLIRSWKQRSEDGYGENYTNEGYPPPHFGYGTVGYYQPIPMKSSGGDPYSAPNPSPCGSPHIIPQSYSPGPPTAGIIVRPVTCPRGPLHIDPCSSVYNPCSCKMRN